jgi:glucose/arabinose dehydrogenase
MHPPKVIAFYAGVAFFCGVAMARSEQAAQLVGAAAYGDWRADAPGVIRKITAADLPAPYASRPTAMRTHVEPRPTSASLKTPPGFKTELVIGGLSGPRVLRLAPNGDVLLAESAGGRVRVLRFEKVGAAPSQKP